MTLPRTKENVIIFFYNFLTFRPNDWSINLKYGKRITKIRRVKQNLELPKPHLFTIQVWPSLPKYGWDSELSVEGWDSGEMRAICQLVLDVKTRVSAVCNYTSINSGWPPDVLSKHLHDLNLLKRIAAQRKGKTCNWVWKWGLKSLMFSVFLICVFGVLKNQQW